MTGAHITCILYLSMVLVHFLVLCNSSCLLELLLHRKMPIQANCSLLLTGWVGLELSIDDSGQDNQWRPQAEKGPSRPEVVEDKVGAQSGEDYGDGGGKHLEDVVSILDCDSHHQASEGLQKHQDHHDRSVALEETSTGHIVPVIPHHSHRGKQE